MDYPEKMILLTLTELIYLPHNCQLILLANTQTAI